MIALLLADKFPETWEPSSIWMIAAIELLILDAPLLGLLLKAILS